MRIHIYCQPIVQIILCNRPRKSCNMSWHELRVGAGLLLAFALIIGGSLSIGLPLALLIIWLLS
jgi:hypothetical protein